MPANNLLLLVEVVLKAAGRIAGKGLVIASRSSAETQWMGSERSEIDTMLVRGQQGPFQVFGEHFLIDAGELHHQWQTTSFRQVPLKLGQEYCRV